MPAEGSSMANGDDRELRMPASLKADQVAISQQRGRYGHWGVSKRTAQRIVQKAVEAELRLIDDSIDLGGPKGESPDRLCNTAGSIDILEGGASVNYSCNVASLMDSGESVVSDGEDSIFHLSTSSESCFDSSFSLSDSSGTCDGNKPLQMVNKSKGKENPLRKSLREWAVLCNVPNTTVYKLLKILKPRLPELPLHPSTLHLHSGPLLGIEPMGKGEFYYFGGTDRLKEMASMEVSNSTLHLNFNIDGLPLFKSSDTEFWPVLCSVQGSLYPPFVWSCWCGPGKPPIESYFVKFMNELKSLLASGFEQGGRRYNVIVRSFICDAVALAYVRANKGHTGYYGCGKCTVRGNWVSGRMTFTTVSDPLRTDESFLLQSHPEFHLGVSPLTELNIGMISCFPLDYLHLICLGVTKRLLLHLLKSSQKLGWTRAISEPDLEIIDGRILAAKTCWPRDFSRVPRSLLRIKKWTATEFRQFLLYLGPVVLRGSVLSDTIYSLFLLLHCGITILVRKDLNPSLLDEAESFLKKFVRKSKTVLGEAFVCYNVHNLVHLTEDCRRLGTLDNFSAFPFENELQVLKHAIRGNRKPLQQLVRRVKECDRIALLRQRRFSIPDGVEGRKTCRNSEVLYKKAQWKGRTVSLLKGDNFVAVDNHVVHIKHFIVRNSKAFIVGKCFMTMKSLYRKPVRSSTLGIFKVSNLGHCLRCWPLSAVKYKVAALPLSEGQFAVFPLIN